MTPVDDGPESVEQENERPRADLAAALAHVVADEALRRSEEKYRRLHETRIDAFVQVDMAGRIVEFNDAYRQMLGYKSEELLALSYQQITPAKWHVIEADIIERQVLARGHSDVYEKEYQRKDGIVFPVELRTILIRDAGGAPSGMWAIIRDITDRKRAEQDLRDSESWLTSAIEVAAIGLYRQVGPSDNRSTFLDARARALLGIPQDQEYRTHQYWIEHVHPDDLPHVAEVSRTFEKGSASRAVVEYRYVRNNNDIVWIRHAAEAAERDAKGRATVVIGILQDVTEQKLAEEALRNLSRRLIAAQEEERSRLARELHDGICQTLALLSINLDQFNRSHPDAAQLGGIRDLIDEVERLAADVRRMSHDLAPLRLEQLGLKTAIRLLCRDLTKTSKIAIYCEVHEVSAHIPRAVSLCLYRVIQEALQNTIKHSGASNANVTVKMTEGGLLMTVTDNGRGFETAAPRITAAAGLANMRERVRAVSGRFLIESSLGAGTRIDVRVPCSY
jgi:PAS domain S-box-containing protein